MNKPVITQYTSRVVVSQVVRENTHYTRWNCRIIDAQGRIWNVVEHEEQTRYFDTFGNIYYQGKRFFARSHWKLIS